MDEETKQAIKQIADSLTRIADAIAPKQGVLYATFGETVMNVVDGLVLVTEAIDAVRTGIDRAVDRPRRVED